VVIYKAALENSAHTARGDQREVSEFLDHSIRCGDSLVGLHDLDQLRNYSLDSDFPNLMKYGGPLDKEVDDSISLRLKLEDLPANSVEDVERQEKLLTEANEKIARLRCAADLLVAAEFWGENPKDKQERVRHAAVVSGHYIEQGPTEEFEEEALKECRGQKMFHWPLEFPEVIVKRGGFDAFVCNPPFMGGKTISGHLGDNYLGYLKRFWNHQKGSADYAAYFFLQAFAELRSDGRLGMISTNSIAQGDTRAVGLDFIESQSGSIYRAENNRSWPGLAAVVVNVVHIAKRKSFGCCILDGRLVNHISTLLDEQGQLLEPERLFANKDLAFQGTIVHGEGFILEPHEAEGLIQNSPRNGEVVFPYLDGQDLNSRHDQTPSRWIINFRDWPFDVASKYPECLSILTHRVKAYRDEVVSRGKQIHEFDYWKFWDKRLESYERLRDLSRVLVVAQTSRTLAFAFVPNGYVYSMMTIVFPYQQASVFSVLQSCFHELWARRYSSTMKEDLRYTPSKVFETFPMPIEYGECDEYGEAYHGFRQNLMVSRREGLTKIYNRFHEFDETSADIRKLRDLHVEMDQAVASAYGWTNLDLGHGFHETKHGTRFTISEPARREVLQRLLKLNDERYAAEEKQGLHQKKGGAGRVVGGGKKKTTEKPVEFEASLFDDEDSKSEAVPSVTESESIEVESEVEGPKRSSRPSEESDGSTDEPATRPTPIGEIETDDVMAAFRQVTRGRGAMERDELLKQVSVNLGYKRLGPKIEEALRGHLRAAIRRRIIEAKGTTTLRAGTTTMADYDLEELRETFRSVMRKGATCEREDVIHLLARYLGFARVTDTSRDAIKSAINSAIRQGVLGYQGTVIWREE
jgi:hypothetical protein